MLNFLSFWFSFIYVILCLCDNSFSLLKSLRDLCKHQILSPASSSQHLYSLGCGLSLKRCYLFGMKTWIFILSHFSVASSCSVAMPFHPVHTDCARYTDGFTCNFTIHIQDSIDQSTYFPFMSATQATLTPPCKSALWIQKAKPGKHQYSGWQHWQWDLVCHNS